jgi:hypothetical protein
MFLFIENSFGPVAQCLIYEKTAAPGLWELTALFQKVMRKKRYFGYWILDTI